MLNTLSSLPEKREPKILNVIIIADTIPKIQRGTSRLFNNLSYPPYPLPLVREGGSKSKRGAKPLSKTSSLSPFEGERDTG